MAVIRIVDDWLRSPVSAPSHYRSVMVIAEKWAEQRVLMRAYADSRDQLRPTITLYGLELAVGPAGLDVNGSWGIHVADPDTQSQMVKDQLEGAARRIAGSKGNPPRLVDEESEFEREPTAHWGAGAPRVLPKRMEARTQVPHVDHYTPPGAARMPQQQAAKYVPQQQAAAHRPSSAQSSTAMHAAGARHGSHADESNTEVRRRRTRNKTVQPLLQSPARTALGYSSGAGAQSAIVRLGLTPQVSARLGWLGDRVVPADFHLTSWERRVLNALGEQGEVTARTIGQLLDLADAVAFMDELVNKLESYNLDLIEPGNAHGGEPAYRLRR